MDYEDFQTYVAAAIEKAMTVQRRREAVRSQARFKYNDRDRRGAWFHRKAARP